MTATTKTAPTSTAEAYDAWFDSRWGRYAFAIEAAAVDTAVDPRPGARVLDVGCGTGRFAPRLEQHGAGVVGLEFDPAMLAVAARHLHGPRVVADAHRLPVRDAAVDVALAVTVLEFTADPAAVIAELARVTRVGGRIVVGSLNPTSPWGFAHRHQLRTGTWCEAHFLDRRQLRTLGARYGRAESRGVLFAPSAFRGLRWLGPLGEPLGRVVQRFGAFQVLVIDRADVNQ